MVKGLRGGGGVGTCCSGGAVLQCVVAGGGGEIPCVVAGRGVNGVEEVEKRSMER